MWLLNLLLVFVLGYVVFLFICCLGLSLLVTAGPCSISIHFISQICRCWCPPFSVGYVAFLFICLRDVSLLVSAFSAWRCNFSIRSPSSLPWRRVSQFFLKMYPPFLSLLVSTYFCWPCSTSIQLSLQWFLYFCLTGSVPALLVSALFC